MFRECAHWHRKAWLGSRPEALPAGNRISRTSGPLALPRVTLLLTDREWVPPGKQQGEATARASLPWRVPPPHVRDTALLPPTPWAASSVGLFWVGSLPGPLSALACRERGLGDKQTQGRSFVLLCSL